MIGIPFDLNGLSSLNSYTYGPAHQVLVLISYVQMLLINAHTDVSIEARGLNFGLSLHVHPYLQGFRFVSRLVGWCNHGAKNGGSFSQMMGPSISN